MTISIESISAAELTGHAPMLSHLLSDVVEGSMLGFIAPLSYDGACRYWLSLRSDLQSHGRVLLIAREEGYIVGSGQLALTQWPNGLHRAEVQKVFVGRTHRGRGIAKQLMEALHAEARERGRSLILLGARRGAPAEQLYRSLGYQASGVIPGYALDAEGERHDNINFYLQLS